ncbi:MAG: hypothetical protein ABSC73_03705 [Acidimicrobiales bacterium]
MRRLVPLDMAGDEGFVAALCCAHDAGAVSPRGKRCFCGRMSDVIGTKVKSVWPTPVEAVARTHPGVADADVGVPDPAWGEGGAPVVETGHATPPTLAELRQLVRGELGAVAAPRKLFIVEALPRTAAGKVRRDAARGAITAGGTGR